MDTDERTSDDSLGAVSSAPRAVTSAQGAEHSVPRSTPQGTRVAFWGRLAGMSKREAQRILREKGGLPVEIAAEEIDWIVVGEDDFGLLNEAGRGEAGAAIEWPRRAVDRGAEVVVESRFWERLGLVEGHDDLRDLRRLYTPAMLAELLGLPVAVIRRWNRRGLIQPVREVRKLPYFDFQEVSTARRLAQLLAAGMSPRAIERNLERLARLSPGVARPLSQLSVIVEGKQILLRQGEGLIEPGGQMLFDFDDMDPPPLVESVTRLPQTAENLAFELKSLAARYEDAGDLARAAETYRGALAAEGPSAETSFLLAETLYRMGQVAAARERYYIAIELDEDFVEARANLGCVLAELGERELAVSAFEGALAFHEDYPDAHYHLARLLDELERPEEAECHWRAFVELAADSPWVSAARQRLGLAAQAEPLFGRP